MEPAGFTPRERLLGDPERYQLMAASSCLLLSFLLFNILSPISSSSGSSGVIGEYGCHSSQNFGLGAILDSSSSAGMEVAITMRIAADDFCAQAGRRLALHIVHSRGDPIRAGRFPYSALHAETFVCDVDLALYGVSMTNVRENYVTMQLGI